MEDIKSAVFNEMVRQSDEMFFIFNIVEKKFEFANAAFKTITKRKNSLLFQDPHSLFKIIHEEDLEYVKTKFKSLLTKKTRSLLDFRIYRPNKQERWIRLKVYPITIDGKIKYLSGVLEDDSARRASIFNMQKVNSSKDSILQIVSHDLRGPIGTVKLLASAISDVLPKDENSEVHDWTTMIQNISQRNLDLIKDLTDKQSADVNDVEITKERIDMVQEINEIMNAFIHPKRKIDKKFEFTHSEDKIFAAIDSMKFLQIMNNLISNAVNFTKPDGVIKVHIEKLEKTVLISVSDNGIGIPRKLQPVLFNKYTPARRKGASDEESVGLGMWIIKSLTEAHNGSVWFESEENKGSIFYIEIPQEIV